MAVEQRTFVVGGLPVQVYHHEGANSRSTPVAVLFLLHGRLGSAQQVEGIAKTVLDQIEERSSGLSIPSVFELFVVTFDQRNHGARLVDRMANNAWTKDQNNNDRHAIDMYSIQTGTARDVSFLIDFLPSYLFPFDERVVSKWLVAGISLGGHSTWITLRHEPRVSIGIPIVGCADFTALITDRAKSLGIPAEPPYIPSSLRAAIERNDAAKAAYESSDPDKNPFLGKKILALSGGADKLVPWSPSETFFEKMNVGEAGVKKVIIAPGVGHECTPEMVKAMSQFVWEEALRGISDDPARAANL